MKSVQHRKQQAKWSRQVADAEAQASVLADTVRSQEQKLQQKQQQLLDANKRIRELMARSLDFAVCCMPHFCTFL